MHPSSGVPVPLFAKDAPQTQMSESRNNSSDAPSRQFWAACGCEVTDESETPNADAEEPAQALKKKVVKTEEALADQKLKQCVSNMLNSRVRGVHMDPTSRFRFFCFVYLFVAWRSVSRALARYGGDVS